MAAAGEYEGREAALELRTALQKQVSEALRSDAINPWCGICNAKLAEWHYELARTRFATMEEAEPVLLKSAAEQAVTNAVFGDLKRSD